MKIIDAISRLDALKFNTFSQSDKVKWLSKLDSMIKNNVIDAHEGADAVTFTGYDDSTDLNTALLVPEPYDDMYLRWMEAQIDYHNKEYNDYNNAIIMFNTIFDAYKGYYNGIHKPVSHGKRFLF